MNNSELEMSQTYRSSSVAELPKVDTGANFKFKICQSFLTPASLLQPLLQPYRNGLASGYPAGNS